MELTTVKNGCGAFARRIAQRLIKAFKKTDGSYAVETIDPIYNLDLKRAQAVYNWARSGNYAQLQRIYSDIESVDPIILTCIKRRSAALRELDWKVVRSDERLTRGADEAKVKAQIDYLETTMARIDNLADAIDFLSLAAFRGYSIIQPVYRADGSVEKFDLLDQWNICYDRRNQKWLWNPEASSFEIAESGELGATGLQEIDPKNVVIVTERMPIDHPGMLIFLKKHVAEHDWGVFIERFGLPPVILTMPENISQEEEDKYVDSVEAAFTGKSGVVPFGTTVSYGTEARGTDPFNPFIEHQQKLIVLMATGGLLTSLAESGSGTLAGNAHFDTWRTIMRADARKIAEAIQKQLCVGLLEARFPGEPCLAEFQFETEPDPTAKEVGELAVLFKNAGFKMRADELSQMTGYTLEEAPEAAQGAGMGGLMMGGETPAVGTLATNAQKRGVKPSEPKASMSEVERLAAALRADFAGVAQGLDAILAESDDDVRKLKAQKLLARLNDLIPQDPVMAGVVADAMEKEFFTPKAME